MWHALDTLWLVVVVIQVIGLICLAAYTAYKSGVDWRKLAPWLIVAALVLLLIAEVQANTLPGAPWGCTYGPLPFGLGHIPALQYWSEAACGA